MLPIISIACISALSLGQQDPTLAKEFETIAQLPKVRLGKYRCEQWVPAMNHLRQLGKEKCLQILKAYFAKSPDHERIHIACRLLFVNPKGWDSPKFGAPYPKGLINLQAVKKFPLFPFAISEGVPFVVVSGYGGTGKLGGGKQCLEQCEKQELIKEDYATTGWDKAARKLVESEDFLQLHPPSDRKAMIDMILEQAKKSKQ